MGPQVQRLQRIGQPEPVTRASREDQHRAAGDAGLAPKATSALCVHFRTMEATYYDAVTNRLACTIIGR